MKKKIKAIEDQKEKQVKPLQSLKPNNKLKSTEDLFPKGLFNKEIEKKEQKKNQNDRRIYH